MNYYYKPVKELIDTNAKCPLPLEVIPNNMGINLCSVDAVKWLTQDDGQLIQLTIFFNPTPIEPNEPTLEEAQKVIAEYGIESDNYIAKNIKQFMNDAQDVDDNSIELHDYFMTCLRIVVSANLSEAGLIHAHSCAT